MSGYIVTITETTVRTIAVNPCRDEAEALDEALRFERDAPYSNNHVEGNVSSHTTTTREVQLRRG